ncbi:cytochrome P450 [Hyaloraphidium curvatum]|nr:cytochrome P450 [Hyaloraphidium curvatum]
MLVTAVLLASAAYLIFELWWRRSADRGDGDAVATLVGVPFINRPSLSNAKKSFVTDLDAIRATGRKNLRWVNPLRPGVTVVVVSDPAVLREIFVGAKWENFTRAHPAMGPQQEYAGGLILQPNGDEWRQARALFDRTFTTPAVRSYVPILVDLRDTFMGQIRKVNAAAPDGFDIQPELFKFTFDAICRLAFGEEIGAMTTKEGEKLLDAWNEWFGATSILMLVNILFSNDAWKYFTGLKKNTERGRDTIYGLIQRGIDRRKRGEDLDRVSILDNAMRSEKLPAFMKNDEAELRRQFCTLLFAGHDTTAGTTAIATHFLAHNPRWQKAIRAEVAAAVPAGEPISLEPLENLPALNAVVKETLRILPAAPYGGTRVMGCDMDFTYVDGVDGRSKTIKFREGDWIFPFVYGAQHDRDYWAQDPDVWDPQRWLDDPNGGAKNLYANSPFGNGARRCIGERLALGETRVLLASILREFDIAPGDYVFDVKNEATVSAANGVKVRLVPVKA